MWSPHETMQPSQGIAFLASYLPRACGIATFTKDLSDAVAKQAGRHQSIIVTAMNDRPEGYNYPDRVRFEIRQDYQIDYSRAADFLNFSGIQVLSLQHEYGIFGGEYGLNVLTLLRDLHRPVVVTCHTVLQNPHPEQKEVFLEIANSCSKLVVMTEKAFSFLEEIYRIDSDKIVLIPHGIHDVPFIDPNFYKDKFGVEGRRVLLTFGLLSRNKGIEYMIEALPEIVKQHPKTTYLVLGATHPAVVEEEGESYRLGLQRRVRDLGLEEHVVFHPRFVELNELLEYIGASDIFIAPYLNLDQITSGALSYAAGAGKAIVSTPFWHAEELLAGGRGRLVPVEDSEALSRELLALLGDEVELSAMRKRSYTHCRNMVWSSVARQYLDLFDEVISHGPKTVAMATSVKRPLSPTNLPVAKIDHLRRLCDDTGPAHHARHVLPDWNHGYHLSDAAGVLVASTKFHHIYGDAISNRLAETCASLIQTFIGDGQNITGVLDYSRRQKTPASEMEIAMGLWALGYLTHRGPDTLAEPAIDMYHLLMNHAKFRQPRAAGYAVLGAANYLVRFPGASQMKKFLGSNAQLLKEQCAEAGWIERWEQADWPLALQAVSVALNVLGNGDLKDIHQNLLNDALERTEQGTVFIKPGNQPAGEESPVSAAIFIEGIGAAYQHLNDAGLIEVIRAAADWFLGANQAGKPLYDFGTGGCHDALTPTGLNRNLGTESTYSCLLAFLTLHRLATIDLSADKKPAGRILT